MIRLLQGNIKSTCLSFSMRLCPLEFTKYGSPHQVYLDAGCYAFSGHRPMGKIEFYSPLLPFDFVHTDGSGKAFRLDLSLIDKIIPMRLAFVPDDRPVPPGYDQTRRATQRVATGL
jgi:hypothetical protein